MKRLDTSKQAQIELLSPVGTWESLVAAVQNGADAVYLGSKNFSARQYADNFDMTALKEVANYCHVRGVKVYLTVNTLIADNEIQLFCEEIVNAYNIGIDAVIVQDLGVASLILALLPDFDVHASTQMTIHNMQGVTLLQQLGFKRVVLARELSEDEITYICKHTEMEIEVFVHGALCVCYSGQCLMSSLIGGRSGNRGRCAQPCRLPYKLIDMQSGDALSTSKNGQYLLSPKDLSLISHIEQLKKTGAISLKIEGRMKRAEYVAAVTSIYRKYLDNPQAVSVADANMLAQVFNREGFTQGYFLNEKGQDMMSILSPKHWGVYIGRVKQYHEKRGSVHVILEHTLCTGDGIEIVTHDENRENTSIKVSGIFVNERKVKQAQKGQDIALEIIGDIRSGDKIYKTFDRHLNEEMQKTFKGNVQYKKVPIWGHCQISSSNPVIFNVWDEEGNYAEARGEILPAIAVHKPLDANNVIKQLEKVGDTPFEFYDIQVDIEQGLSVPARELNACRRKAIEMLTNQRIKDAIPKVPIDIKDVQCTVKQKLHKIKEGSVKVYTKRINARVTTLAQAQALLNCKLDKIYFPAFWLTHATYKDDAIKMIAAFKQKGVAIGAIFPNILRKNDFKTYEQVFCELTKVEVWDILIGNIGWIQEASQYKCFYLFGDMGLNVFNTFTIEVLKKQGFKGVTLASELKLKQIQQMTKPNYLSIDTIVYGRIPLMLIENCPTENVNRDITHMQYGLQDRKGMVFPIQKGILDGRSTILNTQPMFMADTLDDIYNSGVSDVSLLFTIETPSACIDIANVYIDAALFGQQQAVDMHGDWIEAFKNKGFTRGHFHRGV